MRYVHTWNTLTTCFRNKQTNIVACPWEDYRSFSNFVLSMFANFTACNENTASAPGKTLMVQSCFCVDFSREHGPCAQHQGLLGQFEATYHAYWLEEQKHSKNADRFCQNPRYTLRKCRWSRIVSGLLLSPVNRRCKLSISTLLLNHWLSNKVHYSFNQLSFFIDSFL